MSNVTHGQATEGIKIDPMHQFEVYSKIELPDFLGMNIDFTNSAVWMVVTVVVIAVFLISACFRATLIPNRLQSMGEMSYEFIANMIRDNTGVEGMKYFPLIFTLFMFILFANLLGMLPYAFTVTSHLIVTFALAMMVFLFVTIIGFIRHGIGFLKLFVPSGLPVFLIPLLVLIELISYLTRPISLSVRLFANMLAGHTMLKVFASFVVGILTAGGILSTLSIAPFMMMVGLTGLEFLIAFLQAYVFVILTCIYLNDAIHLNH